MEPAEYRPDDVASVELVADLRVAAMEPAEYRPDDIKPGDEARRKYLRRNGAGRVSAG